MLRLLFALIGLVGGDVTVSVDDLMLPTYLPGKPEALPVFLEHRVYQGSSGKVYPYPVYEKISDNSEMKAWKAITLENEYLKIVLLPELGGRVFQGLDKTNNYDFLYLQSSIKPQLVGLGGPWISGGIEFNWPQHHRPSTFDPVQYTIEEKDDGSVVVWMGEFEERMFHQKGMAGFTLKPGKAYLEIQGRLYNRTPLSQTFLWWANPAVRVHDDYFSVFPPDVSAVYDHGKREVMGFPLGTGEYYKIDFDGIDISRFKNLPVPMSYMAAKSSFNFIGGFDPREEAGILHVADHLISPGKKQWTWGNCNFGDTWHKLLSDDGGPYYELMTGVFTDNQPDFSWIGPYETREFTQYFMPYKKLGMVKNATIRGAVNMAQADEIVYVSVYVTEKFEEVRVTLGDETKVCENVSPKEICEVNFSKTLDTIVVTDESSHEIVSYTPVEKTEEPLPEPAKPAKPPKEIQSNEVLYLTGLHLEQYRHATVDPDDYFKELLRRDPGSSNGHMAMARRLMRKGLYEDALEHAQSAVKTLTSFNPNPPSGESFFLLGLCLEFLEKYEEAIEAFGKATWNFDYKPHALYHLARISHRLGRSEDAKRYVERSIGSQFNLHHAVHLLGLIEEDSPFLLEMNLQIDPLNHMARYLLEGPDSIVDTVNKFPDVTMALVAELCDIGEYARAYEVLSLVKEPTLMLLSAQLYVFYKSGIINKDINYEDLLQKASIDYCFPNSAFEAKMLRTVIDIDMPNSQNLWKLTYCLGNFYYDKRVYDKAIFFWMVSLEKNPTSSAVLRNLAIAKFNKKGKGEKALMYLENAFTNDSGNPRLLFELDQLKKRMNVDMYKRLSFLEEYSALTHARDATLVEYLTILNNDGKHKQVLDTLMEHNFHPWEGGEGKVSGQFITAHVQLALKDICTGIFASALEHLKIASAPTYPENLGEGKLASMVENDLDYYKGLVYLAMGNISESTEYFRRATEGSEDLGEAMFYNDSPAEMIWFQGMAHLKLGKMEKARAKFSLLEKYGKEHVDDAPSVDYFAVSLPSIDIFDSDLKLKNKIHCLYLMGLGYLGQKELGELSSKEMLVTKMQNQVLELDSSHQGARLLLKTESKCTVHQDSKEEL